MGLYECVGTDFEALVTGQVTGVKAVARFRQYVYWWASWDFGKDLDEALSDHDARCAAGHTLGLPCHVGAWPPTKSFNATFPRRAANGTWQCNWDDMHDITAEEYAVLSLLMDLWWHPHGRPRLTRETT